MEDIIDAERGFLEQWEEAALRDEDARDWLIEEVYEKPGRLDVIR